MKDNKKTSQLNIRISDKQKSEISNIANNAGYKSISKYLIDHALNQVKIKSRTERKVFVISFSTAIDYFIQTIEIGENKSGKNKFKKENKIFAPGGRGINLSRILNVYNFPNINVNTGGGFAGNELYRLLEEVGVSQHRINSSINTKINVYAEDSKGKDISLEEKTSPLPSYVKDEFIRYIDEQVHEKDMVVFSGSFVKEDINDIRKMISIVNDKNGVVIINTSSIYVDKLIEGFNPLLVVLNMRNFSGDVKSKKDIFNQMEMFIKLGAKEVCFVADVNNTLFIDGEDKYIITSELVDKLTYSGLEDAFIGGYISNINKPIEERLRWGGASVRSKVDDIKEIHFDHIIGHIDDINVKREK